MESVAGNEHDVSNHRLDGHWGSLGRRPAWVTFGAEGRNHRESYGDMQAGGTDKRLGGARPSSLARLGLESRSTMWSTRSRRQSNTVDASASQAHTITLTEVFTVLVEMAREFPS
jgi:hypothetical protein